VFFELNKNLIRSFKINELTISANKKVDFDLDSEDEKIRQTQGRAKHSKERFNKNSIVKASKVDNYSEYPAIGNFRPANCSQNNPIKFQNHEIFILPSVIVSNFNKYQMKSILSKKFYSSEDRDKE